MPAYKDEKRGTWYVRFRYTDWTGKRVETTKRGFAKKGDAQKYEDEAKREKTAAAGMTFGELYKIYLEDARHRLRQTTIITKETIIEKHVLNYFTASLLENISAANIRQWQTSLIKKGMAPTYIHFIQSQFSAVMNYAVKYYGLPSNPIKIAGPVGKTKAPVMDYWTIDEYQKYMAAETSPLHRAAIMILFWAGLRCGEMLALTPADVDTEKRILRVNKTYHYIGKGREFTTPPKTPGSIRDVTIPSVVLDAIQALSKKMYGEPDRIIPISAEALRQHFDYIIRKAGIKRIRIHDLRHSHASYLINKNVPIKIISARLGHDNVETTLRTYAHIYKDTEATVSEMLEEDAKKLFCGQTAVKQK